MTKVTRHETHTHMQLGPHPVTSGTSCSAHSACLRRTHWARILGRNVPAALSHVILPTNYSLVNAAVEHQPSHFTRNVESRLLMQLGMP